MKRDDFGDLDIEGIIQAHSTQDVTCPFPRWPFQWRCHDGQIIRCKDEAHLERVRRKDLQDLRDDLNYRLTLQRMGIDQD